MEPEIEIQAGFGRITPIRYCYRDPGEQNPYPDFIELILERDVIESWEPSLVRLAQVDDFGKLQPQVVELLCQMQSGLRAVFRVENEGIHRSLTGVAQAAHCRRQRAAYLISKFLRVDMCPVSVIINHPDLHIGSLTAMVQGQPLLLFNPENKRTMIQRDLKRTIAVCEAFLFDYLIDSGQRGAASYLVDENKRVISQYHHESLEFGDKFADVPTMTMRLFEESGRTVSQAFWDALQIFCNKPKIMDELRLELSRLLRQDKIDTFFARLLETVHSQYIRNDKIQIK